MSYGVRHGEGCHNRYGTGLKWGSTRRDPFLTEWGVVGSILSGNNIINQLQENGINSFSLFCSPMAKNNGNS